MIHLKVLGKHGEVRPKRSRQKEIINIGVEINEMEMKRTV
jgi:hypothetical protein